MPPVGPDTVPGQVVLSTWVLISAIVALAGALVWLVKWALAVIDRLSAALADNTASLAMKTRASEAVAARLETLERSCSDLGGKVERLGETVERCDGRPR